MYLYNSEEEKLFNWKILCDDLNSVMQFDYLIRVRKSVKGNKRNKNEKWLVTGEGVYDWGGHIHHLNPVVFRSLCGGRVSQLLL